MFRKKTKAEALSTPKDTLIIIGNGFDIWQGLHTDYAKFHKYYLLHRDEIMKKLRIKKEYFKVKTGAKSLSAMLN